MPNFIEIGQTSLEKSFKKRYLFGPSRRFFRHGQKRDYLSRVSQRARGATKKKKKKKKINTSKIYWPAGNLAERAKIAKIIHKYNRVHQFTLTKHVQKSIKHLDIFDVEGDFTLIVRHAYGGVRRLRKTTALLYLHKTWLSRKAAANEY